MLRKRNDALDVAEPVAPGNPFLGVMLPYTPLHHLLASEFGKPLVCTSGNLSEEPMAITTEDALERLMGAVAIADVLLTHNRPIVRPVDDSVVQRVPDGIQVLRRARGFAPLPIALGRSGPTVLAVGGHLKNTVAISLDGQAILSAHVGDLDNLAGVEVHRRAILDLVEFFHAVPARIACDLHPDYASTRHAESLSATWGRAAGAGAASSRPTWPRAWPSTISKAPCWASPGTAPATVPTAPSGAARPWSAAARRFVAWRTCGPSRFPAATWRSVSRDVRPWDWAMRCSARPSCPSSSDGSLCPEATRGAGQKILSGLLKILGRRALSPRTSSVGRLFDVVAALCDLSIAGSTDGDSGRTVLARWLPLISFEGQAAMSLQFAAECRGSVPPCPAYPIRVTDQEPMVIDWEPTIRAVLADRTAGVAVGVVSARFHETLAEAAVAVARRWGGKQVVLSGGCFHNVMLAGRVRARLLDAGLEVFTHHQVPPGDGGIALGQLAVATCSES